MNSLSSEPIKAGVAGLPRPPQNRSFGAPTKKRQILSRIGDNLYRSDASSIIYAVLTMQGRQIRRSLGTKDKRLARLRLEELRQRLNQTQSPCDAEMPNQTFEQVASRWLQTVSATLSQRTLERRQWTIKALSNHFPQSIGKIRRSDVEVWTVRRSGEVSPATYNKEAETLRLVMAYAFEKGACLENLTARLKRRRVPKPQIQVPSIAHCR